MPALPESRRLVSPSSAYPKLRQGVNFRNRLQNYKFASTLPNYISSFIQKKAPKRKNMLTFAAPIIEF
jgi:hypothetical protein